MARNVLREELEEMSDSEVSGEYYRLKYRMEDTVSPGLEGRFFAIEKEYNRRERTRAAVALGSMKSDKKAKASRKNGKKGGRPRRPFST